MTHRPTGDISGIPARQSALVSRGNSKYTLEFHSTIMKFILIHVSTVTNPQDVSFEEPSKECRHPYLILSYVLMHVYALLLSEGDSSLVTRKQESVNRIFTICKIAHIKVHQR